MPAKSTTPAQPFTSDAEYLDAEFVVIRARASRIAAEKSAEVARRLEENNDVHAHRAGRTTSREAKCRSLELDAEEKRLRTEIDTRLAAHRADGARLKLGVDLLVEQHRLSPEERFILLAVAVPGVSQRLADEVFAEFASFYGALPVGDLIALLDPENVGEWLSLRKVFRAAAPLVKAGLIVLDPPHRAEGPDTLLGREVRLSMLAFATITGDPEAATELEANPTGTKS